MHSANPPPVAEVQEYTTSAADLIRATILTSDQIDPILQVLVQQLVAGLEKNVDSQEVVIAVKRRLDDLFIQQYSTIFSELLTSAEIHELVGFYKSESMKKFHKNSQLLFLPVFEGIRHLIGEVLKTYPDTPKIIPNDHVISITEEN